MRIKMILLMLFLLPALSSLVFADEAKEGFKEIHQGAKKLTRTVDKNAKKGFKKVHKQVRKDTRKIDKTAKQGWKEVGHDLKKATKAD